MDSVFYDETIQGFDGLYNECYLTGYCLLWTQLNVTHHTDINMMIKDFIYRFGFVVGHDIGL